MTREAAASKLISTLRENSIAAVAQQLTFSISNMLNFVCRTGLNLFQ